MADLRMNTDKVKITATNIHKINENLHQSFSSVESALNRLYGSWDGDASWRAEQEYGKIRNKYEGQRYAVIENYIKFLTQQVETGYVQTEDANKKLADAFK